MADMELFVDYASEEKGLHRMNIFLKEKGSLLTAVAKNYSNSITWYLRLFETCLKI